LFTGRQGFEPR